VLVNDLGVSVSGEGHDDTPAGQVVRDIKAAGGEAIANYADVADMDQAGGHGADGAERVGATGHPRERGWILRDRMVFNMTEEEWDAVVRVHMKGTFATTRFASLYWRQARNGGRLINFTSGSGLFGAPGQPNYAAAKMGIWGFTLSCARALGRYGVTANSIAPGASTRMTDSVPVERSAQGANRVTSEGAAGTERDPANVAPTCLYLASDEGGWITGRCFGVSGYRVTLYSQIEPQVVLQGTQPWETDVLFGRFKQAFGQAIPEYKRPD
jgi:NAD(P)-dependent dehydrogenase (short-subunit alcohol dehydrogenase family)